MKNIFEGIDYPVYHLPSAQVKLPADPPHERKNITMQLFGQATDDGAIHVAPPAPHNQLQIIDAIRQRQKIIRPQIAVVHPCAQIMEPQRIQWRRRHIRHTSRNQRESTLFLQRSQFH